MAAEREQRESRTASRAESRDLTLMFSLIERPEIIFGVDVGVIPQILGTNMGFLPSHREFENRPGPRQLSCTPLCAPL